MATIHDLPDNILAACLAPLSLQHRMHSAALVCRRWSAVVYSPELLQELTAFVGRVYGCTPEAALEQGRSLLRTLLQQSTAGGLKLLHSFDLRLATPDSMPYSGACELAAMADGCLQACCADAPQLRSLSFSAERFWRSHDDPGAALIGENVVGGWVLQVPRTLRHLRLRYGMYDLLTLVQPLRPWLESLSLRSYGLILRPLGQALPPSLTRLELEVESLEAPGTFHVTQLPRLCCLKLRGPGALDSVGGFGAIAQLHSLRALVLELVVAFNQAGALPANLPSGLQHLDVLADSRPLQGSWNATLARLPALTGLRLGAATGDPYLPALAALSRLQWLHVPSDLDVFLPDGRWPSRLRSLALPYRVAERDLHVLQAADRLEHLYVLSPPAACGDAAWAAFLRWAAGHPPLRAVSFLSYLLEGADNDSQGDNYVLAGTAEAMVALAHARPALRIRLVHASGVPPDQGLVPTSSIYSWPMRELEALAPAPDD